MNATQRKFAKKLRRQHRQQKRRKSSCPHDEGYLGDTGTMIAMGAFARGTNCTRCGKVIP
jgi:hypothetical protein